MVKNVDYDRFNIELVAGDTLDKTFYVYFNNALYDMTGMQLDCDILDEDGVQVQTLTSAGGTPSITIVGSAFTMYLANCIATAGTYPADLQLTDGTKVSTIWRGNFKVIAQRTT